MAVIRKMGFVSYFLITWDFIRYAKEAGIPVERVKKLVEGKPNLLDHLIDQDALAAKGLLAAALESEDPVIFFEPVVQYFERQEGVPVEHYTLPIGRAKVVRPSPP